MTHDAHVTHTAGIPLVPPPGKLHNGRISLLEASSGSVQHTACDRAANSQYFCHWPGLVTQLNISPAS